MIAACEEFAPELVAYLDGEHAEREAARIEAHVGTCLSCRRELEQLRHLRTRIGELHPIEPSAGFDERFWQRLETLPSSRRRSRLLMWTAPALAAAAAVALVWYSSIARVAGPGAPSSPRAVAKARAVASGGDAVARRDAVPERGAARDDVATADDVGQYPPDLVEHPELYLHLPVVRRLQKLEHFEEVRQHDEGEPLGELAPIAPAVG